jgi:hypothetical protein
VLRFGPEVGDAPSLVVGVEVQVQADGIVDAAHEAHAGVGLFLHDALSLCCLHYSIDVRIGQTPPSPSSWERGLAAVPSVLT